MFSVMRSVCSCEVLVDYNVDTHETKVSKKKKVFASAKLMRLFQLQTDKIFRNELN